MASKVKSKTKARERSVSTSPSSVLFAAGKVDGTNLCRLDVLSLRCYRLRMEESDNHPKELEREENNLHGVGTVFV